MAYGVVQSMDLVRADNAGIGGSGIGIGTIAGAVVGGKRDKVTVIALREMAAGKYGIEILARNRTDPASFPAGGTANENTWNWITEPEGETARDKVVPAQPA